MYVTKLINSLNHDTLTCVYVIITTMFSPLLYSIMKIKVEEKSLLVNIKLILVNIKFEDC